MSFDPPTAARERLAGGTVIKIPDDGYPILFTIDRYGL